MSQTPEHPIFPVELERLICETTAFLYPRSMRALLLVAHRIHIWIEPLLYMVLQIYATEQKTATNSNSLYPRHASPALAQLLFGRPASFFHDNVRHVCFMDYHPEEFIVTVLSLCDTTENLAFLDIMGGPSLLPILDALPLKQLSVCLDRLFFGLGGVDFSRPFFTQITHLDIVDWRDEGWDTWSGLAEMPRLTHLSFSYHDFVPYRTCKAVLAHCKSLQVLVLLYLDETMLNRFVEGQRDLGDDPRFVMVAVADHLLDWEKGTQGRGSYWDVADAIVEERQLNAHFS